MRNFPMLAAIAALLHATGCGSQTPQGEAREFSLGPGRYEIRVPDGMILRAEARQATITRDGIYRQQHFIVLSADAPDAMGGEVARWRGARLAYRIEGHGEGAGSGGPEFHLAGALSLDGRVLSVRCGRQTEDGTADSLKRWCLDVLTTLSSK